MNKTLWYIKFQDDIAIIEQSYTNPAKSIITVREGIKHF